MCLDRRDFLPHGLPRLELLVSTFTAAVEDAALWACMSDVDAQIMQDIGRLGQYAQCTEGVGNC